jgi:hypothetical protein
MSTIKFSFEFDHSKTADIDACAGMIQKVRETLAQLRSELNPDEAMKAQIAAIKEAKRIGALPKLWFDGNPSAPIQGQANCYMIGEKRKVTASEEEEMKLMPTMTRAEAHVRLCELLKTKWNTDAALKWKWAPFLQERDEEGDPIPGLFRGMEYQTDEEIAEDLAWDAGAPERERIAAEEKSEREEREAAEAKRLEDERLKAAELAEVEKQANEKIEDFQQRTNQFNLWLSEHFPSEDIGLALRKYLRNGMEPPIRPCFIEKLIAFYGATDADAHEIADMLEAYGLNVWEVFSEEEDLTGVGGTDAQGP